MHVYSEIAKDKVLLNHIITPIGTQAQLVAALGVGLANLKEYSCRRL